MSGPRDRTEPSDDARRGAADLRLPRVVCITKATIWDNMFFGGGVRLAAYIRNDAPLPMIRRAAQAVRDGSQLLIFPEGSRTAHGPGRCLPPELRGDRESRRRHRCRPCSSRPTAPICGRAGRCSGGRDCRWSMDPAWPALRGPGSDPRHSSNGSSSYFRQELPEASAALWQREPIWYLIPSYNTGPSVLRTVREARAAWKPVWVVVDGSTDGTDRLLQAAAQRDPGLGSWCCRRTRARGAAVLHGLAGGARQRLHPCADDGCRRPASRRARSRHSWRRPDATPGGDGARPAGVRRDAPRLRVQGRRISNWLGESRDAVAAASAIRCSASASIPIAPLLDVMERQSLDAPLRLRSGSGGAAVLARRRRRSTCRAGAYLSRRKAAYRISAMGGTMSLLTWMHTRLVLGMVLRLAGLLRRRRDGHPTPALAKRP